MFRPSQPEQPQIRPRTTTIPTTNATKHHRMPRSYKAVMVIIFVWFYLLFHLRPHVPSTTTTNGDGDGFQQPIVKALSSSSSSSTFSSSSYIFDPTTICDGHRQDNHIKDNSNTVIISDRVYQDWDYINETLHSKYPSEQVSGGIFLYPRQAATLTGLVKKLRSSQSSSSDKQNQQSQPFTICETGFGSGHSTSLFAHAAAAFDDGDAGVRVVSFDRFDRPYQLEFWKYLNETLSSSTSSTSKSVSFDHFQGDSCRTVLQQLGIDDNKKIRCDFLHGSSKCGSDNIDLISHAPCGVVLTSTAMLDLKDRAVYFGPRAQWRSLRDQGCITTPICIQEKPMNVGRDYIFAKEGTLHIAKWCVAVSTGKCRPTQQQQPHAITAASSMTKECEAKVARVLAQLQLDKLCPNYRVVPPP